MPDLHYYYISNDSLLELQEKEESRTCFSVFQLHLGLL